MIFIGVNNLFWGLYCNCSLNDFFRYNPRKYADDDDVSDMEANFDDILEEERRRLVHTGTTLLIHGVKFCVLFVYLKVELRCYEACYEALRILRHF